MSDDNNINNDFEWVLITDGYAKKRNFKNSLALKRWCKRRGVGVKRDGKLLWIRPRDMDAAVAACPMAYPPIVGTNRDRDDELVLLAVNQFMKRSA